ncbi:hypothetical protein [Tepidibacter hydrothermalis]|uniref:Uncharacterized protein n=1 Tax=Tepidibacter hydrothermalis TaxID=3036126 RepID=A0ABY8E7C3_9FIRM|nr:hypothetical protein [Tepidibacter hydrothermalis]WFD08746.1 hypothetical protein P4S50_10085 [Tepidibacter hydrothermalis]
MTIKEGQKEGIVRRYVFTCKVRDLTSKLEEAILQGRMLKALNVYR